MRRLVALGRKTAEHHTITCKYASRDPEWHPQLSVIDQLAREVGMSWPPDEDDRYKIEEESRDL